MRLNEVIQTSATNLSQKTIDERLSSYDRNSMEDTGVAIGDFALYKKPNADTFVTFDDDRAIAYLSTLSRGNNQLEVRVAGVDKRYKRQGLMTELYKRLVTYLGYEIISDKEWTTGAEMLWKKLIAEPNVHVNVYDASEKEIINLKKNQLPRGFFKDANLRLILQRK